jgi:transposase-like protein
MAMAELVVAAVLVEGRSTSEVAREYGVSRRWVITLVQGFLADGEAGLVPRSRRPHANPNRTPQQVEDEVIALRKNLDRRGHDAGAATIAAHPRAPARRQPGGLDDLADPVRPRVRHPAAAQAAAQQLFSASPPTSPTNAGSSTSPTGRRPTAETPVDAEILSLLDDHSRFCLAGHARRVFTAADVDASFRAAAEHGDPAGLLSDNAAVFTGHARGGGRVALEVSCHARGIRVRHSRPYHPQTCGKVSEPR